MTGSIHAKKGKLYFVINTYHNGKRRQKWIDSGLPERGGKNKARKMLRELLCKLEEDEKAKAEAARLQGEPDHQYFWVVIDHWLEHIRTRVDEVTFQGYNTLVDVHIRPYFQEHPYRLCEIDTACLQTFFDQERNHGNRRTRQGLSPKSLRHLRNILYQVIEQAVGQGILNRNPVRYVELPRMERREYVTFSPGEMSDFLEQIQDDMMYPVILCTYIYGLRRSEVLGLQWDAVDFDSDRITIRRTVVKVTETIAKDKTKTQSSRRSFPMTDEIRQLFHRLKDQQEYHRSLFGTMYTETNYVFTWQDGRPFTPDYVSKHFRYLLDQMGMKHVRFHDLRHSSASNLLSMGFGLKDVMDWLGHSDIQTTANIYGHIDVQRKKELAEANSISSKKPKDDEAEHGKNTEPC